MASTIFDPFKVWFSSKEHLESQMPLFDRSKIIPTQFPTLQFNFKRARGFGFRFESYLKPGGSVVKNI